MTTKVVIVSHSYIEPENQKNLQALSEYVAVSAVVPRRAQVLVFDDYRYTPLNSGQKLICAYPTLRISSSQYVFLTMRLVRKGFCPDVVVVEYNPWSLAFLQVWLCKLVYFPKAKLVSFVKKNTYRNYTGLQGKLKDWLANFLVRRVDYFIAGSEKAAAMLSRRFGRNAQTVAVEHHLGVDAEWFCPKPRLASTSAESVMNEPIVIVGYCGRFDEDKGVLDLVDAVREVRERTRENVVVTLLGRGSLGHVLRTLSANEPWIEVYPPVSNGDVAFFLRRLNIFVLPSKAMPDHEEHDAHALLEALSCGLACVATDVGINVEIIRDGNGILVPRARMDSLVEGLVKLVVDPAERERLGRRAREVAVRDFSLAAVAGRKASVLRRISGA